MAVGPPKSMWLLATGLLAALPPGVAVVTAEQPPDAGFAGVSRNCRTEPQDTPVVDALMTKFEASTDDQKRWAALPPRRLAKVSAGKLKMALLMFVKDRVGNANMWLSWMRDANASGSRFSVHVHAYGNHSDFGPSEFRPFLVNDVAQTRWCDIWDAQMLMLRRALADREVTHLAVLSDDSVPLKRLSTIVEALHEQPATRLCGDFFWPPEVTVDTWWLMKPRAETWWVMRREDAELFADHRELVNATFRVGCAEEQSWFYPLLVRHARWGDAAPVLNECRMLTDWLDTCKGWADHMSACSCTRLREMPHREGSAGHPRTYEAVDEVAWQELQHSPFWWGRKFADGAFAGIRDPWPAR